MRAKLQDGKLIHPPNTSTRPDGTTVVGYAMREDLLIADGWKPVALAQRPDGPLWVESYQELATEIRQVWTEREKTDAEKAQDAQETARQAAAAQWQAEHTAKVEGMRAAYRASTRALCREARITEADVLTAEQLEMTVLPLLDDVDNNAKIKRNIKSVAYLVKLLLLTMSLKEEDGRNALDRV